MKNLVRALKRFLGRGRRNQKFAKALPVPWAGRLIGSMNGAPFTPAMFPTLEHSRAYFAQDHDPDGPFASPSGPSC